MAQASFARFPYTFRKPGKALQSDSDRVGDPTLKARIKQGAGGQHDAIVTWAVEGAMRWYADPARSLTMTTKVEADTRAWRSEADRIMGFWDERLIADLYACILTLRCWKRLATGCRSTITSHGPKKPFGPRFEQHAETKRHGVTVARPLQPKGLSR